MDFGVVVKHGNRPHQRTSRRPLLQEGKPEEAASRNRAHLPTCAKMVCCPNLKAFFPALFAISRTALARPSVYRGSASNGFRTAVRATSSILRLRSPTSFEP